MDEAESGVTKGKCTPQGKDVNRQAASRVVLLDRDGTIIEDPGYLADPDGVRFLPGAVAGLRRLGAAGFRLVVVTNQSGVGRGLVTEEQVAAVHARLRAELEQSGVHLAGVYYCPHRPDEGCGCRKPATGLATRAAAELGFPIADAIVVGDKASDLQLARALGVPSILVLTGEGRATAEAHPGLADYVVADLVEAAGVITWFRSERSEEPAPPCT
ncbi:MAG: HAD-IIIA family hydrolase [Gemmatimonadota bacterium]|nr:HAD-IIIA family hydrolase [Gemmatimonadota bacterium]